MEAAAIFQVLIVMVILQAFRKLISLESPYAAFLVIHRIRL